MFDGMSKPQYNSSADSSSSSSAEYFLKLAATYAAGLRRGFISTLTQLNRFDWIPPSDALRCVDRLESAVLMNRLSEEGQWNQDNRAAKANELSFEHEISTTLRPVESTFKYPVTFTGCVDIESPKILWEIKCVGDDLETTHFLQLAIYAWLWNREQNDLGNSNMNIVDKRFRLLNVLSGESWELDNSCMIPDKHGSSPLNVMMSVLFKYHYRTKQTMDDDAFLKSILINQNTESTSNTKSTILSSLTQNSGITRIGVSEKLKRMQKQKKVDLKPVYVDKYGISHSLQ